METRAQLLAFLEGHKGESGIVYCMTRGKVEEIAAWLAGKGWPALPYHAGLDKAVRDRHQDRFVKEDGVIVVATIAFGMGIDKPDVRFVAHVDVPKSLEAYYQETGRAGRAGLPSEAFMLYGLEDVAKLRQLLEGSDAPDAQKQIERRKLDSLIGYCETASCRRQALLSYFGEQLAQPCGNCDTCLEPVETFDGTELAQKALSCVYRTGQRFGVAHVVDVLRGADTEKIGRFRQDALSTYGIGKDLSAGEWRSVLRQLVAMGLLYVDIAGHGGLKFGPDCRAVLRGERRIELRRDSVRQRPKRAEREKAPTIADGAADHGVFEALRARRMALAKAQGVPPYVIFHDSTLMAMAAAKPRDIDAFARLPGVGGAKLSRYGQTFLAVIAAHERWDAEPQMNTDENDSDFEYTSP
jgi:ATP-dependent DNA helicase RecQ